MVSFLTDFGNGDEAIYRMKSSTRFVNPGAAVEDICHDVPMGNILVGAQRLLRAVSLPTEAEGTAYVVVVDPGVGTDRKGVIVRTRTGKFLVGPDNGVLSLAFGNEGVEKAVAIENEGLTLLHLAQSSTFHGKDVFAPVAAHLVRGVPLREFGPGLTTDELVKISISSESSESRRAGYLVDVDGFGSIRTNLLNGFPDELFGRQLGFSIRGPGRDITDVARLVHTFGEADSGDSVLVQASTGYLDLAVVLGSAAERFGIRPEHLALDEKLSPAYGVELSF